MSAVSTVTTLSWNERVAVDEEALQTLLDRWRPVVSAMCAPRPTVGGERDDLGEEGMIGLFTAIRDYDMSIRIHFTAFLERCVSQQIRVQSGCAADER